MLIFSPTLFKYALVGITATLVDVGSLYIFVDILHVPILVGTILSFILAVIDSFILNKYWTFGNTNPNIRKQFIKFLLVSIVGLLLTVACMWLFVYVLHIWYILSKLLTSGVVFIWNFLGNKYWSFKDKVRKIQERQQHPYDVSIIVPAFNEENRIKPTLVSIDTYFSERDNTYEIIVVDDGSSDQTSDIIREMSQEMGSLKLVSHEKNSGKGFAVQTGVKMSKGAFILFTDADNSTPIEEFEKFEPFLETHEVIIGSRYITGSKIKVKQSPFRIRLGRIGNTLIQMFLIDGIKDTQCGFKAFQYHAAQETFGRMKTKRFGFDMEILVIANLLGYTIKEIPVAWYNSPDSRFRPIRDSLRTLRDLIYIKLNLWSGRYR